MKNFLLLILLFSGIANAQVVSIPDINFKLKLLSANTTTNQIAKDLAGNWTVIDTNGDNLIQQSEASAISSLDIGVNANYNSLSGLQSFDNLKAFIVGYELNNSFIYSPSGSNSNLNTINFGGMIKLENVQIGSSNNLTSLNFQGCNNLTKIEIPYHSPVCFTLTQLDLSNLPSLEDIDLSNLLGINSLNISGSTSLKKINLNEFQVPNFDLANFVNLEEVNFGYYSNLQSINFNGCINLKKIYLNQCHIPTLNLSNLSNLQIVECGYLSNYISTLGILGPGSLQSINLQGCTALKRLILDQNLLTTIDLSDCHLLETLDVQRNQLTSLDLSSYGNLQSVNCDNNNLEYISFKNNTNEAKSFLNNPNLTYICADDAEQNAVQLLINLYEMWDTCVVGDYCSFTPNGNYNTISGNALYDNENDGCDVTDEAFEFLRINMTDGTNSGSTYTNFEGDYSFFMNAGNFTLTPQLENPTYFAVSPTSVPVTFADNLNNTANQNFCITPNGVHNDLEIVLAQVTPARPGFDAEYSLVYKNKGNQPLSGAVSVTFDDSKLDFVSATIAPTVVTTGLLSWSYTNLLPFENRSITFTLNVNSPMETPAVNNDDVLGFTATITPVAGDEIPADNTHTFNQTVVGSFDPNDIYCLEGETVDPSKIGEYLHYNVRFENTGTFEAENIVVTTTINPDDYDLNSLQVLNASHNVYTRLKGNLVEFVFENIQLEGSPNNGHGYLLFKIRSSSTLQTNDQITTNANIYFDYNFPVVTNDATTTFQVLSNQNFIKDDSISIYPNPTSSLVNINSDSTIKSIDLYDVQGRLLQTKIQNQTEVVFDISDKSNGIYFLKITSDKGSKVEKVVKK